MMIKTPIEINGRPGIIEQIYITELEYLMIKVYFPKEKIWVRYSLGKYYDALPLNKINEECKKQKLNQ